VAEVDGQRAGTAPRAGLDLGDRTDGQLLQESRALEHLQGTRVAGLELEGGAEPEGGAGQEDDAIRLHLNRVVDLDLPDAPTVGPNRDDGPGVAVARRLQVHGLHIRQAGADAAPGGRLAVDGGSGVDADVGAHDEGARVRLHDDRIDGDVGQAGAG